MGGNRTASGTQVTPVTRDGSGMQAGLVATVRSPRARRLCSRTSLMVSGVNPLLQEGGTRQASLAHTESLKADSCVHLSVHHEEYSSDTRSLNHLGLVSKTEMRIPAVMGTGITVSTTARIITETMTFVRVFIEVCARSIVKCNWRGGHVASPRRPPDHAWLIVLSGTPEARREGGS